jgi:8-oxo-dGTP diphosphatase
VSLDIWSVTAFEGEATGMEGQEIAWVPVDQLMNYDFPEANRAILEKILG